jgi:hypothetical protein
MFVILKGEGELATKSTKVAKQESDVQFWKSTQRRQGNSQGEIL